MLIALLVPEYLVWHYTAALRLGANIVVNFIWFTAQFFSVPVLAKTLKLGFSVKAVLDFVARVLVLLFAAAICVGLATVGALALIIWFFLPPLVLVLVLAGIKLLIP